MLPDIQKVWAVYWKTFINSTLASRGKHGF